MTGAFHEDQYALLIISLSVPLRMKNVSDKSFMFNNLFF